MQVNTFLIIGTAPSLSEFDLSEIQDLQNDDKITTLSCNGILQMGYNPDYLMIADRRPYIPELESGRLAEYAERGVLLLSNTIWDPHIRCAGTPVQEKPKFQFVEWRVGAASTPFNWSTFKTPLCSFATATGQMLQAAVILGATRIGIIGIDMIATKEGTSMHCYNDGGSNKGATIQADGKTLCPKVTYVLFAKARQEIKDRGIEITNLSPLKASPFAEVFGQGDYDTFMDSL